MRLFRLFVVCLIGSLAGVAQAQDASPTPTAPKPPAVSKPESGITFDWIHVDGPYIALTFDDGPSSKLTPKLLDLLAAHHIKATFFLIGENAAQYPEFYAREAKEGHEVANHSWSHPNFGNMSDDGI